MSTYFEYKLFKISLLNSNVHFYFSKWSYYDVISSKKLHWPCRDFPFKLCKLLAAQFLYPTVDEMKKLFEKSLIKMVEHCSLTTWVKHRHFSGNRKYLALCVLALKLEFFFFFTITLKCLVNTCRTLSYFSDVSKCARNIF